eukprot:s171_g37.t2
MAQRTSPLGLAGRPLAGSALRCALWAPVPRCRSCRAASTGPPVKEGEVLEMRMETLTSSGQALGRIGPTRWVVMIFGALPRELVQLRIVRNYRSRSEARLCRILEASPERAAPRCPLFMQCSGCQYQHLSYESQLYWKREHVKQDSGIVFHHHWSRSCTTLSLSLLMVLVLVSCRRYSVRTAFVPGPHEQRRPGVHCGASPRQALWLRQEVMPGKDIVENLPGNFWKGVTLFNAVCWGSSYISTKAGIDALSSAGVEDAPVVFGALRFVLAALPLLPWLWKSSSPESARSSAVVGSLGAVAYAAVFVSFSYGTTGAKAAFITALQTTVVASLSSMAAKRLNLSTFCSALLALGGVGVLEFSSGPVEATIGDLICMASPILIGLSWHVLGESTKKFPKDATPTAAIQLLCFGMLFAVWSLGELLLRHGPAGLLQGATHFPELLQTPGLLPALLFSAFFGNTVTMLLSSEAMKRLKASDVSLIVASEPLWAALAAAAFLGEAQHYGRLGDRCPVP